MNLKDVKPQGKLESAGSFNAMCTHRVKVEHESEISNDLITWLKNAYEQAR